MKNVEDTDNGANTGPSLIVLRANNPLPVIPRDQEGLYSCWATSAEMIMEFTGGVRVRQCQQAGRPSSSLSIALACCDNNGNLSHDPDCDSANFPEFGRWGFDHHEQSPQALNWQGVTDQIDNWTPFAFSWVKVVPSTQGGPAASVSHMMVVTGYNEGAGQQVLFCLNPRAYGSTDVIMVPYTDYSGNANTALAAGGIDFIHQSDWFDIKPFNSP